jgi:hypothetical protein
MPDPKCERCRVSCPEQYMEECGTCPQPLCPVCAEDVGLCQPCEAADRLAFAYTERKAA